MTTFATDATETQRGIVDRIASDTLGETLDAANWTLDGECEPWLFDQAVFNAAFAARKKMTEEDVTAFIQVGEDTRAYYKTMEELRAYPGGRDFATAFLIVAMYRHMETIGLVD